MPFVRYDHPPKLLVQSPLCRGCDVEVEFDGKSFVCPDCGTAWDTTDGEDTPGNPYSAWSGEDVSHLPLIEMGSPSRLYDIQRVRNQQVAGEAKGE